MNDLPYQQSQQKKPRIQLKYHLKHFALFIGLLIFSYLPGTLPILLILVNDSISFMQSNSGQALTIGANLAAFVIGLLLVKRLSIRGDGQLFTKRSLCIMVIGYLVMLGQSYLSLYLQSGFENARGADFLDTMNIIPGYLLALNASVVMPLLEEIVFRGFILKVWFRNRPLLGVIISCLLFMCSHGPQNIVVAIMYFLSGLCMAYVYKKTDRIEAAVIVHWAMNLPGGISFFLR